MADLSAVGNGAAGGAGMGASFGPWGALAGGIIGGAMSFFSSSRAAELQRMKAAEDLRRMTLVQDRTQSEATALGAASGVTTDSASLQTYLSNMRQEFQRQRQFAATMAAEGISASEMTNTFNLYSNIGGSLFNFAKSNNFWQGGGQ